MMAMSDNRKTFIILRSDHGLQGGPYPIDYATQIEHMQPWTAIISPASHQSLSIGPFSSNQNNLVTGFDIYHSLRYLMSPLLTGGNYEQGSALFSAGIPPWSYNLFHHVIPQSRNCRDAKIPKEFCPCIIERRDMVPNFYIGYSEKVFAETTMQYDWTTMRFIPHKLPGVSRMKDKQRKYNVRFNKYVQAPKCNSTIDSYIDEKMLQDSWQLIENITAIFPNSSVSGGVFLYPRQALLLVYLIQREIASRTIDSANLEPFRICETGFGSGHSAALFLSSAPNVEVVSFDKFDRPYQSASFHALRGVFGSDRLIRVIGNSCQTVPAYTGRCDFLHGSSRE